MGYWPRRDVVGVGVVVMAWPERMVLGVLGRRADGPALARALELAHRWGSDVHVVAGYHPPVGMFPHVVTEQERVERRAAARRGIASQLDAAVAPELRPVGPRSLRITVVAHPQLDHTLVASCREADLLLFSLAHTGIERLARRLQARAERVAAAVPCPAAPTPHPAAGATVGA